MKPKIKVSASQIQTFEACPRAWYYDKIDGVPRPDTKSQGKGRRVHSVLESYLTTGVILLPASYMSEADLEADEDGSILEVYTLAVSLLKEAVAKGLLPDPRIGISVEEAIQIDVSDTTSLHGFIDAHHASSEYYTVIDHKTTSNLSYAKTAEQLRVNMQMGIYAKAMRLQGHAEPIKVSHINYLTRNKNKAVVTRVDTLLYDEHIAAVWERVERVSCEIEKLHETKPGAQNVYPGGTVTGHCKAFGGCPYKSQCGIQSVNLASIMKSTHKHSEEKTMSNEIIERLKAQAAARKAEIASHVLPGVTLETPPAEGVLPPDAAPREYADPITLVGMEEPPQPPKRRGRPPGKKSVATLNDDPDAEHKEAMEREQSRVRGDAGSILLIGCAPVKGDSGILFEDWIAPILARVAELCKVPDFALTPHYEGKGVIVGLVQDHIRDNGMPRLMSVSIKSRVWEVVSDTIIPHAQTVIRGGY